MNVQNNSHHSMDGGAFFFIIATEKGVKGEVAQSHGSKKIEQIVYFQ